MIGDPMSEYSIVIGTKVIKVMAKNEENAKFRALLKSQGVKLQ